MKGVKSWKKLKVGDYILAIITHPRFGDNKVEKYSRIIEYFSIGKSFVLSNSDTLTISGNFPFSRAKNRIGIYGLYDEKNPKERLPCLLIELYKLSKDEVDSGDFHMLSGADVNPFIAELNK